MLCNQREDRILYLVSADGRLQRAADERFFFEQMPVEEAQVEFRFDVDENTQLLVLYPHQKTALTVLELRAAFSELDDAGFSCLSRASQIGVWADHYRYCSRCGSSLHVDGNELFKQCPSCEPVRPIYPRISPCIIVLITRGDRCLLAHNARFPGRRFSTLAGFIEAGETAEETVAREVQEEVGLEVENIRYFSSQSWPFPNNLMLGFFADHKSGEIMPDGDEITEAGWFGVDDLPQELPPSFTIARQLIEGFLAGEHLLHEKA